MPNASQDQINKFSYLYSQLTKKRNITKRWGVLYLLNSLSKKSMNCIGSNALQNNLLNKENYSDNNFSPNFNFKNNNNSLVPISNVLDTFNSDNNKLILAKNEIGNNPETNIVVNQLKTSAKRTEKDLINNLLYVFEGISDQLIIYDQAQE